MNEEYFSSIDSPDKAYWLGFLFADGCVYEQKSGRKVINISQKEADHPASFLNSIGSSYRVGSNTNKNGTWHRVNLYSEKMFDDLVSLGCAPGKSKILLPPKVELNSLTRDFIRGYNDGDGGFYLARKLMRLRSTPDVVNWIQQELPMGSKVYHGGPTSQLFVMKRSVLLETIGYLYDGATLYMQRKYDVAMKIRELQ